MVFICTDKIVIENECNKIKYRFTKVYGFEKLAVLMDEMVEEENNFKN
jgi:hypothetical protein